MTALRPIFALVLYRLLCLFCAMLVLALPQMASSSAVCMADLELGSAQVPISEEEVHKTCVPGLDQAVLVEHAALCVPAGASCQQDDYVGRCGEVAVPPPKQ